MTDLLETRARRFLESISAEGAGSLEALGGPERQLEAMLPRGAVRPEMQNLVEKTAEKIIAREQLNPPEQFALEAIIIPDKRPPVPIANGDYQVEHPLWLHLNEDSARKKIRPALPSIGRIELPGHPSYPYGGTGFVVGDGLLMTNRHVAEIFCGGLGNRGLVFRPGHRAGIDFKREVTGGSLYFEVVEVMLIHPYWDMALLRVEGLPDTVVPLSLSLKTPAEIKDSEIVVIGYPAFDPRNNASVQNEVFGGIYDVKRLMPGKLTGEAAVASFGKSVPSAKHDSSTLGGASGSAAIAVETGEVVALHFSGVYLESNYGVPTAALACDNRVTDLGLNFSGTPEGRSGPWDEWWRIAGSEAAGISVAVSDQSKSSPSASTADDGASASWTIPIDISVKVG
ncbi:MAG TPA: serine protease, partial [Sphingomicrobium sp.]|nr:serine protease [Sphingomicrobium sp.]